MGRKKNIIELTHCDCEGYRKKEKLPFAVMADNVRSMQNVGAIFRTCDAFLADSVILTGITATPPNQQITKSALGAEESVAWRYAEDSYAEALRLKEEGWKIVVLEQTHSSIPLQDFRCEEGERYVLVVGNEVNGVDQRIVDIAEVEIEIPMHGVKHSLNVSVSAGIAIWQIYQSLQEFK